jgi:nucleoside-diphosphate-sugar epimerase
MSGKRVALVAGARGIVGGNLVRKLLENGWSVIGVARSASETSVPGYRHLSVDLLDANACLAAAAECTTATHMFYAARVSDADATREADTNAAMLRHVMEGLLAQAAGLRHVTLVHGTKWYGSHLGAFRTPAREDDPRYGGRNFYYDQQDYVASLQQGKAWRWSTVRPHIVCGLSLFYPFNCVSTLAAYGSLCRELGRPLGFPGTPAAFNAISQATDADLLADSMAWTAEEPRCANQAYNIINGDYFRWCNLWPSLAAFFDVETGLVNSPPLATTMQGSEEIWAAMVRRHGLRDLPLSALANWQFGDFLFKAEWDVLSSIVKCRQHGFQRAVDTEHSFLSKLSEMRKQRLIP